MCFSAKSDFRISLTGMDLFGKGGEKADTSSHRSVIMSIASTELYSKPCACVGNVLRRQENRLAYTKPDGTAISLCHV